MSDGSISRKLVLTVVGIRGDSATENQIQNNTMNTAIELFHKAQDGQLTTIGGQKLAVLKSYDVLHSFKGEDDYQIGLATIVNAYPEGILLTKIRQVLPDSLILEKAIKALVEKKEIVSEPYGKRSQLLKPVKKEPAQPPRKEGVTVDTNPTDDPKWEPVSPAPVAPPKPAPNSTTPTEEATEG